MIPFHECPVLMEQGILVSVVLFVRDGTVANGQQLYSDDVLITLWARVRYVLDQSVLVACCSVNSSE